jgi:hypothetical protein
MLWHRVFTQLVAATEQFKIFYVMVLEGLSASSKKPMSSQYMEPFQSISFVHNLISFQIQFNIIIPLILVAQVDCVHQVFHLESYAHNSLPYDYCTVNERSEHRHNIVNFSFLIKFAM